RLLSRDITSAGVGFGWPEGSGAGAARAAGRFGASGTASGSAMIDGGSPRAPSPRAAPSTFGRRRSGGPSGAAATDARRIALARASRASGRGGYGIREPPAWRAAASTGSPAG